MNLVVVLLILVVIAGIMVIMLLLRRNRSQQEEEEWWESRRTVLLKILVAKNNEKTPQAAENVFAALHGIFRFDMKFQEHISFEIAAKQNAIEFYLHCPVHLREFIEGQVYAQYPDVEIQAVDDYATVDVTGLKITGTELKLNKIDVYPIKTFQNFTVDPLAGITGVFANTSAGEQMWVQTLIRPVDDSWQDKGIGYVAAVRAGKLQKDSFFSLIVKGLIDLFKPSPAAGAKESGPPKLAAPVEQALKAVEEKATKLGYETKIRIVAIGRDATSVQARVNAMTGVYKQFNTINMNGFGAGAFVTDKSIVESYRERSFRTGGDVFNIEELASVFHFPNVSVETPSIVWAGAKKGEPPADLPLEGTISADDLTVFGLTNFRGKPQRFGILTKDRRQHMYALGKSGTGKSTLLENMAVDDIRKGRGVAIVDPHGDFVNHVLDFIPASRINDVIVFSPADKDFPVGFNILEQVDPQFKNIVASGVVGIFKKLWADSWGPRLEYILRNVILALLEYPDTTLLDVMRTLVNQRYRDKLLAKVTDPVVREFFLNEYNKWDPKFRTESIQSIQNKVGQFLSASTIRNILGQPKSTFSIEEAMNTKKIVLMDLSMGKIGEDAAAMLGSMMITKIQLASMRRAAVDEEDRVDFYLYVDEFQNFATESFAVILSEARKYRLNLIMTNQYITQMPQPVADAVFGNIGTIVSFRVGVNDASKLQKEFEPVFDATDLINLNNYQIYAKMSIKGVTSVPFSAITLAPYSEHNQNREKIITQSRERYAKDREFVEQKIIEASESSAPDIPGGEGKEAKRPQDEFGQGADGGAAGTTPKPPRERPLPELAVIQGVVYAKVNEEDGPIFYLPTNQKVKESLETLSEEPAQSPEPLASPTVDAAMKPSVTEAVETVPTAPAPAAPKAQEDVQTLEPDTTIDLK